MPQRVRRRKSDKSIKRGSDAGRELDFCNNF
jgi:hypothetical protein